MRIWLAVLLFFVSEWMILSKTIRSDNTTITSVTGPATNKLPNKTRIEKKSNLRNLFCKVALDWHALLQVCMCVN